MTTGRSHWRGGARRTMRALRAPALATGALAALLLAPIPAALPGGIESWPGGLIPPIDKIAHFVLFFAAAWPWRRSLAGLGVPRPALAVIAGGTVYAALLELAQGALTATRTAEGGDLVAGALGSAACALWLGRRRARGARKSISRPAESSPEPR